MVKTLLVSTFEGGFQPMTVASAATHLLEAGMDVTVLDTYVDGVREELFLEPELVAISIPLFDALYPGIEVAQRVRTLNPRAHVTFFGPYATINAYRLTGKYGDSCVMGEWEVPLYTLARRVDGEEVGPIPGLLESPPRAAGKPVRPNMTRDHFRVPARHILPPLAKYPQAQVDKLCGQQQIVGVTEIARGCHHRCLYCSVYAVYDGKVLLVPEDVVLADVRNLMVDGMTHLSFVDADFFNAKYHGIKILRQLHAAFPTLTYDFTTRVDHILENQPTIKEMAALGVQFITSALEFSTQAVLDAVAKETTLEEVEAAIAFLATTGITLNPTFIMFNPWIGLEDLAAFRAFVERNGLDDIIDPIQYETRLHLYKGSPLLRAPVTAGLELIEHEFHYEWQHPDPRVDALYVQSVSPPEEGVFKRCCLKC